MTRIRKLILQNTVNPEGEICFSASGKATLIGNRGRLHNGQQQIVRASRGDKWLTCVKERQSGWGKRPLMEGTHYTVLFFLDEATALAARFSNLTHRGIITNDPYPPKT